jgi:plastocyanin
MNLRSLATVTVSLVSLALLTGCPDDSKGTAGTAGSAKPGAAPKSPATGAGSTKQAAEPAGGSGEAYGKGVIAGVVKFTGEEPLPMEVPKARKKAKFCQDKEIKHNALIVNDGKVQDVWVGIWNDQVSGDYEGKTAKIDQKNCVYHPRMTALMPGQEFMISNSDPEMHNVQAKFDGKQLFNSGQPAGSDPIKNSFENNGIHIFQCSVHPWMRAFAIVTDNPFSAVTGEDGSFKIEKVPDGEYNVVAWHSFMGKKEKKVKVEGGEVKVEFAYDGTEDEPAVNKGELDDLF